MGSSLAGERILTYHSRPWSAIDAIVNAGRDDAPDAPAIADSSLTASATSSAWRPIHTHASLLLSRILNATSSSPKPCIQFVACGNTFDASPVAMAVCQAAATILGRSLLIDARMQHGQNEQTELTVPGTRPDAFLPGLSHYHLASRAVDLDLLFGRGRRHALMNLIAPFEFVAIDCRTPRAGPASIALAPMCHGTILVVQAGRSNHGAIKETSLNIIRAGGRVIGSVLAEAPENLPSWIRRA